MSQGDSNNPKASVDLKAVVEKFCAETLIEIRQLRSLGRDFPIDDLKRKVIRLLADARGSE